MNRTFRNGILLTAILALAGAPAAWAVCNGVESQPVWNGGLGYITNCPDASQVSGWVYLLSNPAGANSGAQSDAVVCEQGGVLNEIFLPCQPEAANPGDVTIYYDFGQGNPGAVGCPNPTQAGPDGVFPVAVQVVCNNGAGAILVVGYAQGLLMYLIEQAYDLNNSPIQAGFDNGPFLTSFNAGPSPSADNVCVHVNPPVIRSDCDADAQGNNPPSTCNTGDPNGGRPPVSRGDLYYVEAPCNTPPNPRLTGWTKLGTQPDAAGNACNMIDRPTTAGNCGYMGASGRIGSATPVETGGVIGFFKLAGPAASNDKVKIDKAEFVQGKLIVGFSTTNETSIVGFNVYSGETKLNGSPITAKGSGSNPYTFEIGRGALKGGKSVQVESVKSDGSREKTDPVTLK